MHTILRHLTWRCGTAQGLHAVHAATCYLQRQSTCKTGMHVAAPAPSLLKEALAQLSALCLARSTSDMSTSNHLTPVALQIPHQPSQVAKHCGVSTVPSSTLTCWQVKAPSPAVHASAKDHHLLCALAGCVKKLLVKEHSAQRHPADLVLPFFANLRGCSFARLQQQQVCCAPLYIQGFVLLQHEQSMKGRTIAVLLAAVMPCRPARHAASGSLTRGSSSWLSTAR